MFGFGAPRHPEYPVISFICSIIILLPISSHWKARNVATLSMIAWLFLINIIRFVNTLVWANNVVTRYVIWCDITTKLTIGVTIALPAAALCITKYLEQVASIRQTRPSKEQKKARMRFEALMCFGLPCLIMALHYITQGHRFDIYEDFGCSPSTVITWVAIMLIYVVPLVLSLISFVYAALAIRHFYYRRLDFIRLLQQSNTGMSANRYVRLMLLALTEMIVDTSVNVWVLVSNLTQWSGLVPYTSWSDIHYNFSRIQPFPRVAVPAEIWRNTTALWYVIPIATFLFWAFFAFGQESIAEYRTWYVWFRRVVLRRPVPPPSDSLPSAHKYNPNYSYGQSSKKSLFKFKVNIPKFSFSRSGGTSSSGASQSPTTPATPKGQKFELELKGGGKGGKDMSYSIGDGESFVSADDKAMPLSPISPMTPVSTTVNANNRVPAHYREIDLDTSVFDTISHVTVPSIRGDVPIINEPTARRSASPEIQQLDGRPSVSSLRHPMQQVVHENSPSNITFGNTAVPRPITPSDLQQGVKVQVDINVV